MFERGIGSKREIIESLEQDTQGGLELIILSLESI